MRIRRDRLQSASTSKIEGANFASRTIWTNDNLHIMRGINSDCVDLCYLDPPFNSNRNYAAPVGSKAAGAAFKDTWNLKEADHYEHGELAERNPAAYDVIKAARTCHSKSMMAYLIYMAVRLMEIERILKPNGSVYLHCDDTAGAYLRVLMDGIFGATAFRSHITWQRSNAKNDAKRGLGRVSDTILHYAGDGATFNPIYVPYEQEYIDKFYRFDDGDARGRYWKDNLANPHPGGYDYHYKGYEPPAKGWRCPEETMRRLDEEGRLVFPTKKSGRITRKRYLSEGKGKPVGNIWTDIGMLRPQSAEMLGYPTQKPVALLKRIIDASSNPGDLVFDPFCGCATTLVAADTSERKWAGCDISPRAVEIVKERLGWTSGINNPKTDLKRTDQGEIAAPRTHAQYLYGLQGGYCKGCKEHYPPKLMEVDHIEPRSKGGSDHLDNLQLLCSHCNRSKGGRNMSEWRASQKSP